jgi:hypothetical protein
MGYYTKFNLEVINDHSDVHHLQISQASEYGCDDIFEDDIKWYTHDEDMRSYSTKYPDLIFKLSGEGEEAGDMWVKYYKNGKMQRCHAKITFDEFDEEKLK